MSIFNQFPWTNFREYNLDWVIRTVQDCKDTVDAALADVSNAVAMYFLDHIDTTLSVSGDAADAAATGNKIVSYFASHLDTTLSDNTKAANAASVGTAISNVQMAIPALDPTLSSAQAAAPASTVGSRLTTIQNDITNLQAYVSAKTYNIELDIETMNPSATLTPHTGELAVDTCLQLEHDLRDGYGAFINVHRFNSLIPGSEYYDLAYGIYLEKHNNRVLFETHDYTFIMLRSGGNVVITFTAKS